MCDLLEESIEIDVESFKYPPLEMSDMTLSTFCGVTKERFQRNYERACEEFIRSYDQAVVNQFCRGRIQRGDRT